MSTDTLGTYQPWPAMRRPSPGTSDGRPLAAATQASPAGGILLATDGSTRAADAVRLAFALAKRDQRRVQVLAVVEPLPLIDAPAAIIASPIERARSDALYRRVRDQLREMLGVDAQISVHIDFADPARAAALRAETCGAELLIVGVGRAEPLQRLVGGGEALRIMRRSPVPVLAVAPGRGTPPATAVAAVDFAESSTRAAWAIASLLEPGGTLWLMHARPALAPDTRAHAAMRLSYDRTAGRLLRQLRGQIASANPSLHVTTVLTYGHPARAAIELAERVNADVVAAGRHGHGPVERLVVGDITATLLNRPPCSVLIAPARAKSRARGD